MEYSVLMSVYYKEMPEYLYQSMKSIFDQTIPTNDFVLVCDGPLNAELDSVIEKMQDIFGDVLHVIRLEKNNGLGIALNEGIKYCKNELIARMDSDDISKPYRCEKQLEIFELHPEFDIVGGIIEEFSKTPENIISRRVVPEHHQEILKFAKTRNPFNHMTVMFKKSAVKDVGGYKNLFLLEDYSLWVSMLQRGSICHNLQQSLVYVRISNDMYRRRSSLKYIKAQKSLFDYMRNSKFISLNQYYFSLSIRIINALLPNYLRKFIYKNFLR